jgi:hypothetical protein
MANITDWYGQNDINWGKLYSESWWGSVNEANSWGIIYPESAEGSNVYADTTSFTSDTTSLTADNGVAGSLATFACSDAGFIIQDGTTGDSISLVNDASVIKGTLNSILPSTYQSGSSTYTANITIPAGYSNSGQTITTCTDTATGSAVSEPTATSTYWWSPNQADFVGVGVVTFTYTFDGITYSQGIVDTSTELSNYDGDSIVGTGSSSRTLKIDTASPQVGSYIFEGNGTIVKDGKINPGNIGFWENFATPKFISIKSSSSGAFGGNTFSPFPIYKLGQVGEYVKITEIITS